MQQTGVLVAAVVVLEEVSARLVLGVLERVGDRATSGGISLLGEEVRGVSSNHLLYLCFENGGIVEEVRLTAAVKRPGHGVSVGIECSQQLCTVSVSFVKSCNKGVECLVE